MRNEVAKHNLNQEEKDFTGVEHQFLSVFQSKVWLWPSYQVLYQNAWGQDFSPAKIPSVLRSEVNSLHKMHCHFKNSF